MILKTLLVVAALTAAGTPAAMMLHERDTAGGVAMQPMAVTRPVIRDPDGTGVNIRSCPWASNVPADENTWRIDCKVIATVPNGTHATMVCWRDEEPPWKGASPRWFQVRDVEGVPNVDPPIRLWVWADYVDDQTDGTPRCTDVGREREPIETTAPPVTPKPVIKLSGTCTTAGGMLHARTTGGYFEPSYLELLHIGIWRADRDFENVRDLTSSEVTLHPDGNISWNFTCAGLGVGEYAVGVQVMTGAFEWGDFYVSEAPRQEAPKPQPPTQPQPDPVQPQPEPPPSEPAAPRPKPSKPAQPKPTPKPRISNFQVVVYDKEPGRVGVSYNVAWDEGRDPVTCHFFIDNVERFKAQCGTYSSKQFYNLPEGNHTFYATVSDRHGVYSDPSPKVTKYVPGKPVERSLTIYNKVTNGSSEMREDTPAYLSTVIRNYCRRDGCAIGGTDMNTGANITGLCWLWGDRTTNGEDGNSRDDGNPGLYTSTRWYKARHPGGAVGYISEVWIDPAHRGGAGLPAC